MISWQLWRAMQTPFVSHPIYWYRIIWYDFAYQKEQQPNLLSPIRRFFKRYPSIWGILLFIGGIAIMVTFGLPVFLLISFGVPLLATVALPPLFVVSVGTVTGFISVLIISDTIAVEKIEGRFILMGLTPQGIAGALWALTSLRLHTNPQLDQARMTMASVYLLLAAILFLPLLWAVGMLIFVPGEALAPGSFAQLVIVLVLLLSVPLIDYFQSTTVGTLVGMLAPLIATGRANTRGYGVTLFLTLQFTAYLTAGFLCLILWPYLLYGRFGLVGSIPYGIISVVTFYAVREVIIYALWRAVAARMEINVDELNRLVDLQTDYLHMIRRGAAWVRGLVTT